MRNASCNCGQLTIECAGEPVRVSVCHCGACQRRSGSAFAAQARWHKDHVTIQGDWKTWQRVADSGNRITHRMCPTCGSTMAFSDDENPDIIAIPVGAFADPTFPAPKFSVYEESKHPWINVSGEGVDHLF